MKPSCIIASTATHSLYCGPRLFYTYQNQQILFIFGYEAKLQVKVCIKCVLTLQTQNISYIYFSSISLFRLYQGSVLRSFIVLREASKYLLLDKQSTFGQIDGFRQFQNTSRYLYGLCDGCFILKKCISRQPMLHQLQGGVKAVVLVWRPNSLCSAQLMTDFNYCHHFVQASVLIHWHQNNHDQIVKHLAEIINIHFPSSSDTDKLYFPFSKMIVSQTWQVPATWLNTTRSNLLSIHQSMFIHCIFPMSVQQEGYFTRVQLVSN